MSGLRLEVSKVTLPVHLEPCQDGTLSKEGASFEEVVPLHVHEKWQPSRGLELAGLVASDWG
jgi:hypothetical protein